MLKTKVTGASSDLGICIQTKALRQVGTEQHGAALSSAAGSTLGKTQAIQCSLPVKERQRQRQGTRKRKHICSTVGGGEEGNSNLLLYSVLIL